MIIKQFIIRQLIKTNHFRQIQTIKEEIKKENNLQQDYHQVDQMNQIHQIQKTIIKQFILKQQIKTSPFKPIQTIKVVIKKESNPLQDYHQEDLTNQIHQIQNMIIKLFILKQRIRTNHFKQIQLIKGAIRKENSNLQDYHQVDQINQILQTQNTIIKLFILKQPIRINHFKQIQIIKGLKSKMQTLISDINQHS
jgi:hypothetical protein